MLINHFVLKILIGSLLLTFTLNAGAQNPDINLLNQINGPSTQYDNFFRFVSNSVLPLVIATPVTLYTSAFIQQNSELKQTAGSLLVAVTLTTVLKHTVKRERPFVTYPNIIYQKQNAEGYSFPSGHTSQAFSMATSLSLAFPKWYVIAPSFLYASTVGYSRMYLGVHYPTDVMGGAIIGIKSAFLVYQGQKWLNQKKQKVVSH
jgi:undecaprenyl-diphosphatase